MMRYPPNNTWQEMKAKLRQKYMSTNYYDKLCVEAINLKQNSMSIVEYMQKFDAMKT